MRLRWDAGPGLDITDRAQLDQALDGLLAGPAATRPLVAHLVGGAGALGLGLDAAGPGLLLFAPADRAQPALHSVSPTASPTPGAHDGAEASDLEFSVGGQPHRFSAHCRVPQHTVRAAAHEYLATGTLPGHVTWQPEQG